MMARVHVHLGVSHNYQALNVTMNSYYQQQMEMASALSGLHDYYSRMMDCLIDHVDHQFGFGLRLPVSGNGQTGQLTVIISGGGIDGEPIFDSIVSAEQKTSSYFETNIVSVDRAATPNLKGIGQGESALMSFSMHSSTSDEKHLSASASDSDVNWMFCIERTGTSKKLVMVIIVVSLLVIVLCVCTGTTAPSQPYWHEKLSINGDLDYLKEISNDQLLISTKPQEPVWSAAPLPLKIPVHAV